MVYKMGKFALKVCLKILIIFLDQEQNRSCLDALHLRNFLANNVLLAYLDQEYQDIYKE